MPTARKRSPSPRCATWACAACAGCELPVPPAQSIDGLGKHPAHLEHGATPAAARSVVDLAESRRQHVAGTVEKLIANSIHTAFIKYPEGDGDANMDYDWISPEQSSRITKAILLDLAANGFEIVKKGAA